MKIRVVFSCVVLIHVLWYYIITRRLYYIKRTEIDNLILNYRFKMKK